MSITFTEEAAPVFRRPVEENPFTDIVNAMPVVGDGDGQVAPGTPGSARSFTIPGGPETKGDSANPDLTKAIRKLSEAANRRTGGAVSVRKTVTVTEKATKGTAKTPANVGTVKVLFYLTPKIRRSASAVASTPNTT